MGRLLPEISIEPCAPAGLRPEGEVWLEIGSGGGEHLAGQASRRPDVLFLAAEPFLDGIAKTLSYVEAGGLKNIRLWRGDGRDLIDMLADASTDRVFILFPDPWPKARHRKRRLIQPGVVASLHRILRPSGRLRFATDWSDYAERALGDVQAHGGFEWTARRAEDWTRPPEDHVATRYQAKRLGDCDPVFLDFVKAERR